MMRKQMKDLKDLEQSNSLRLPPDFSYAKWVFDEYCFLLTYFFAWSIIIAYIVYILFPKVIVF